MSFNNSITEGATESCKCIVLLSGGLDSTTVLAYAAHQGYICYALSFDYGQRHNIELNSAKEIARRYNCTEHKVVSTDFLAQIGGSALTDSSIDVPNYTATKDIPITYVPARNTIFLSLALSWAEVIGAQKIFIGASSIDYSGYPDCRPEYFRAYQELINQAIIDQKIELCTPLINLTKAQTIELGLSLGVDYKKTISCYQADHMGRACGTCDSCTLRKNGFSALGVADQTLYR